MAVVPSLPPVVSAAQLRAVVDEHPDVRLLDVRTTGEFEGVHIPGSYNVPLATLGEHGPEIRAGVDQPLVLVCHSGQRARRAEAVLQAAGMPNLHVLDGGISAWIAAGLPVRRGSPRLSLERQVRIAAGVLAASGGALAVLVDPLFALVPLAIGSGLIVAGLTNRCGLALLLTRLPHNQVAPCDVATMVAALTSGSVPPATVSGDGGRAEARSCC